MRNCLNIGYKDLTFEMQEEILEIVMERLRDDVEMMEEWTEQAKKNAIELWGSECTQDRIDYELQEIVQHFAEETIKDNWDCKIEI